MSFICKDRLDMTSFTSNCCQFFKKDLNMKITSAIRIILLGLTLVSSSCFAAKVEALGRSFIIYCAPDLPDSAKVTLKTQVQYFIAGGSGASNQPKWGMRPGDTLRICDGSKRVQIGETIHIPETARTPVLQLQCATGTIKAFLEFLKTSSGDGKSAGLNLPLIFSDELQEKNARILLVGSPTYHDDVVAHDMRDGWLGDGYFNQPRAITIFSVSGKKENLKNATVRFCTLDVPWGTSNKLAHQEMVKRFWAIFINECGGNLVSFHPDLREELVALASSEAKPLLIDPPRDAGEKSMKMHQSLIQMQPPAKSITPTDTAIAPPVAPPQIIQEVGTSAIEITAVPDWITIDPKIFIKSHPLPAHLPAKDNVRIGLTWSTSGTSGADLDLHVRPAQGDEELSFRNTKTPQGKHYKDFSNPQANNGFELVDIDVPVDPKDVSIWINAFKGQSRNGFDGEVRVLYGGSLGVYPIHIPANKGNEGANAAQREKSPDWVQVKVRIPSVTH